MNKSNTTPRIPGFYQHNAIVEQAQPFAICQNASEVVVFFHGLTGSPFDFREYVKTYQADGYDVVVPLLPGHGSHISQLERLSARELYIPFEPLADYLLPRYQKVHMVGMSYGGVLTGQLALRRKLDSVAFLAPAFFLTKGSERNMRLVRNLKIHNFKSRISKRTLSGKSFQAQPHTYTHVPLLTAAGMHECAQGLRAEMTHLDWHVFHAHGEQDSTTSAQANRDFLSGAVADYTFFPVPEGIHVLTTMASSHQIAEAHIAWMKGL